MRLAAVLPLVLLLALPSLAQAPPRARGRERASPPLDAAAARALAARFLRDGPCPPRPDLDDRDVADLRVLEAEDALHGQVFDVLGHASSGLLRFALRVERARGDVLSLSQPDLDLVVPSTGPGGEPRPPLDVQAEVDARTSLDEEELLLRAEELVAHLVPDAAARSFEQAKGRLESGAGPVRRWFTFVERPAPGVLACYANTVEVGLNPETGAVVAVTATALRCEVREPPPVTGAAAREAAQRATPSSRATGAELRVLLVEGAPRAVWVVTRDDERRVVVCARDGRVLAGP